MRPREKNQFIQSTLAVEQGGAVLEKYSVDKDDLKYCILSKVDELVECVQRLGKEELFQITIKYDNGELTTITDFARP